MKQHALVHHRVRKRIGSTPKLRELTRAPRDHIGPYPAFSAQPATYPWIQLGIIGAVVDDDEQVPVAVLCRVSPRTASEQPHLLGMPARDDSIE